MKQYCRYCMYSTYGDVLYCWKKEIALSESYAKHTNTCKDFVLNEIDVFDTEKRYKPRKVWKKPKQQSLFEQEEKDEI